ncbi:rab5 family gtpase [Anaeramoeba ignava]|uniref:Rab5 family gtpase n=1 Tax=Anaeramoeba ignava TaxID=1746090 RepID=A0A9Q0LLW9_ANAIG|nr:rab5 family gtpase [Anaeramoeba ignava]
MNLIKTYQFKVVLIGESGVGKTCLAIRLTKDLFQQVHVSTIGSSFYTKIFSFKENEEIKLEIWDTAGQERYNSLTRMYFRDAVGAICVYDITDKNTFFEAKKRIQELKNDLPDTTILLIGNKVDVKDQRKVKYEEAAEYAKENEFLFYESSAKSGENVEESFKALASLLNQNNQKSKKEDNIDISFNQKPQKKWKMLLNYSNSIL